MYRLYIDETGNADLKASQDPNHRYLSLTGVILHLDVVRDHLVPELQSIKHDIFGSDPDEPLVLHRKELVNKNYPFHALRDPRVEAEFNARLLRLMNDLPYEVISVVIDKLDHLTRYQVWRHDPYHYCLEVLLERYVMLLKRTGARGDVVGEVRGGKSDRRLEHAYQRLWKNGNRFIRADNFQDVLTSHELKLKPKIRNIAGLQFADLIAHPSAAYIRFIYDAGNPPKKFGARIADILVSRKYDRRGIQIHGVGIKWLP